MVSDGPDPLGSWAGYLRALWSSAGHTQAEFVELTGLPEGQVARWLAGIAVPSTGALGKIARAYGMPQLEVLEAAGVIDRALEAARASRRGTPALVVPGPGTAVTVLVRGVVTDGGWVTADGAGQWLLTAEQLAAAVAEGRVWVR